MIRFALRDALRSLRRSPGFTLMIVGMLAVGVGLNSAIFAAVDAVLLRPLGYHDADRLVSVQTRFLQSGLAIPRIGGGDFVDLSQQVHGLESAAYYNNGAAGVQVGSRSSIAPVAYVSPQFAQVLGLQPVAGRLFLPRDKTGTEAVVAASFAREHFTSPVAAIGQALRSEGRLYTIVGVVPDGFRFPDSTQVWLEANAEPEVTNRSAYNQRAIAKLRSGSSLAKVRAEIASFSQRLQQNYAEDRSKTLEIVPLQQQITKSTAPTLHLLFGSVALVLLIVCANITHLQLVRATRQMQVVALRSALGASRAQLTLRAVAEAVLLSAAGCAGALLVAYPALKVLVHLAPSSLPRLFEIGLNWHVLLYSVLVSTVLTLVTSLLPVWRSWRGEQSVTLRHDSTRGLESRARARLRSGFLVAQIALTLVLAATAVLLARQLTAQAREDLGFTQEHLDTLDASIIESAPQTAGRITTAEAQQRGDAARLGRLGNALDTLRSTPGVIAAEAIDGAPLGFGGSNVSYAIRGKSAFLAGATLPSAEMKAVTPGFLDALRVPLLQGRSLTGGDRAGSMPVLLVSKQLADTVFPGEDPIGKQIMCGYDQVDGWWTIVGVTGSLKSEPGGPLEQTMYVPVAQHAGRAGSMQLLIRTAPGSALTEESLRLRLTRSDAGIAATATSMAENLKEVQRGLRFRSILFNSFAGVSVLLAMVGIYGATAYSVAQRTFEFGLRMALGASRQRILAGVLQASFWVVLAGSAIGVGLYAAFLRVTASLLGKLPSDPVAVLLALAATLLLSLVAAAVPARRASTVDPMRAMRTE